MATVKMAVRPLTRSSTDALRINLGGTRYPVVASAAEELGIVASDDSETDCNVYWVDGPVPLERYLELRPYQKINHFPGMGEISRKDSLARNVHRMKKENSGEYYFFPETWVLPADHGTLLRHMGHLRRRKQCKTFIVKPHNGSMGNGIYLTQSPDTIISSEKTIVQEYLEKPFLLDGFKCDLRIYVLVTSCKPLRIMVFKDGLVRLSTEKYQQPNESNLDQAFMHLTNYSVNKHSASFDGDEREDQGSKRTLSSFFTWLHKTGHNTTQLWTNIHDVIVKTLILAYPHLLHSCTVSCHGQLTNSKSQFFEILGFDILLDYALQPWLLEINRSPSFGTDATLDLHIKTNVIRDALRLANISLMDKQTEMGCQRQASRRRLESRQSHTHSGSHDFFSKRVDAVAEKESRRAAAKERLSQLRKEKELEEYENENKGGYIRVYPTSDPCRARLYSRLIDDSLRINSLGGNGSALSSRASSMSSRRGPAGNGRGQLVLVEEMDESELLEILSQYEDDTSQSSCSTRFLRRPSVASVQSLALQDSNPLEDMFQVMASRLHEEEQTQRTMVALKEMAPFYPGRSQTEVQSVLEKISGDFSRYESNIYSFWKGHLDNNKRKELLAPVKEAVMGVLHTHWRRVDLSGVQLHRIISRLISFFLSQRGEGLWSTMPASPSSSATSLSKRRSSWETHFKKRCNKALSVAEMECCRRIAELSHCLLYCTYHYHTLTRPHSKQHQPSFKARPPSLPQLHRLSSLTTPPRPHPHKFRPRTTH